ncbi:cytochrome P450 [Melanogaster broomeanus]|nr:cytochrome P450 [Melanogaster broomeanus]
MQIHVPLLPDKVTGSLAAVVAIVAVVAAAFVIEKLSKPTKLDTIPTFGSTTWLGSWWAGIMFIANGIDVVQQGCEKHKAAPFKISRLYNWMVIMSGRKYLEEIAKCPEDELSALGAANESLKIEYTLGHQVYHNPYHNAILRSRLTRNIGILCPEIRDEVVTALEETLNLKDNEGSEWKSVPVLQTFLQVICRATNRIFVGLPLCRNPDWIDLNIRFTLDAFKASVIMGFFPNFMTPLVAPFVTTASASARRGMKLLCPIIEERQKYLDEYGTTWADKPNDLLSWLMDDAEGSERTVKSLTMRILAINFAAIHTSSNSFTQALYNLAANPQYIQPLREEVESVVGIEGWTKAALTKMHKIDSFLKESQRFEGLGALAIMRRAPKDFTFSDGTMIPKGTMVSFASRFTHLDNELYENAETFDPFRFSDMRDREEDGEGAKYQMASTSPEYLAFGHGRHACPGRFFAASELKTMLAHIVVSYDIKLEDGAARPESLRFLSYLAANTGAKLMFRRRVL